VVHLGESIMTLATNGVARLVVRGRLASQTILDNLLFSWPYFDDLWLCGGFTMSGAGSLQWLADLFGIARDPVAYDALLDEAGLAPPGSGGVIFLPYLAGRGTPHADLSLRGGFVNLDLAHGRAELARAVLEGIAFALAEVYDEFMQLGFEIGPLRMTGGGARSLLWRQIITDVLDRPATLAGGDATLGCAMVAAVGLGVHTDFAAAAATMVRSLDHVEPDPGRVARYADLREHFTRTRDALLGTPRPGRA
jgi:xylulokinase